MTDLPEMGDALETKSLVKTNGAVIGRVNPADHHMLFQAACDRKQGFYEYPSDAEAANIMTHVDRMLYRIAVSWPCAAPVSDYH